MFAKWLLGKSQEHKKRKKPQYIRNSAIVKQLFFLVTEIEWLDFTVLS